MSGAFFGAVVLAILPLWSVPGHHNALAMHNADRSDGSNASNNPKTTRGMGAGLTQPMRAATQCRHGPQSPYTTDHDEDAAGAKVAPPPRWDTHNTWVPRTRHEGDDAAVGGGGGGDVSHNLRLHPTTMAQGIAVLGHKYIQKLDDVAVFSHELPFATPTEKAVLLKNRDCGCRGGTPCNVRECSESDHVAVTRKKTLGQWRSAPQSGAAVVIVGREQRILFGGDYNHANESLRTSIPATLSIFVEHPRTGCLVASFLRGLLPQPRTGRTLREPEVPWGIWSMAHRLSCYVTCADRGDSAPGADSGALGKQNRLSIFSEKGLLMVIFREDEGEKIIQSIKTKTTNGLPLQWLASDHTVTLRWIWNQT
ncbi:hypothetical protein EDB92DRAFT_1815206 [Lactarius akahatsu]|uniref:Uncharacterized protein n=1 Tax=Lactarius akahatsu TaxID=416441 RepID=A0AAD4LJH3_9AGAM|nr:hypothetical protein EDB92DRAFT_1815206 [Lactarius akahatsu]